MLKHSAESYAETPLWVYAETQGCDICWNSAETGVWHLNLAEKSARLKLGWGFEKINMVSELSWREVEISADRK